MIYREAGIIDIEGLSVVRLAVKENVLNNPALVTYQDYANYLTAHGKGWLCEENGSITGFAIVDITDDNIWALFVHPEYEGKGIGKKLHHMMLDWYFSQAEGPVWLGTASGTRAAEFYARQGWTPVGMHGNEIKFELTREEWKSITSKSDSV